MFGSKSPAVRRAVLAGATAASVTAAGVVVALAAPAMAAVTTLFASPSGTGTTCSAAAAVLAAGRAGRGAVASTARCPTTSSCSWPTGCTG